MKVLKICIFWSVEFVLYLSLISLYICYYLSKEYRPKKKKKRLRRRLYSFLSLVLNLILMITLFCMQIDCSLESFVQKNFMVSRTVKSKSSWRWYTVNQKDGTRSIYRQVPAMSYTGQITDCWSSLESDLRT